jgi:hypothetical protein
MRGHLASPRRKKTARLAGGFSGILWCFRQSPTLSIRQRLEMPKEIKVKLGGHDRFGFACDAGFVWFR